MSTKATLQPSAEHDQPSTPAPGKLVQRSSMYSGSPHRAEVPIPGARVTAQSVEQHAPPPLVDQVLGTPGQALDPPTRAFMEPRFGHDFGKVRIHSDAQAAESARAVNALAYTVGNDIVFGAGQYAPDTGSGRRLLGHELTHVVQQAGSAGTAPLVRTKLGIGRAGDVYEREADRTAERVLGLPYSAPAHREVQTITRSEAPVLRRQPRELSAIPATERQALTVGTIAVDVPTDVLNEIFPTAANNNRPGTSYNAGDQAVFGTGIPANLQRGLQSVGGYVANQTNALPLNTTISLALDLTPYGGTSAIYRFTFFRHTERGSTSSIMLIELIGPAPAAAAAPTATAGPFTVRGQNFTLGANWTDARFGILQQAIGLLPDTALTAASGLTFDIGGGTGPNGEAGEYSEDRDAITIFGNAFPTTNLRFGTESPAVRNIVHEIGHALDLRPLGRAWQAFNQAGQSARARRTFLAARSVSGSRYVAPTQPGGNYTEDLALDDRSGAFRQAVRADGVRRDTSGRTTDAGSTANLSGGITSYSDTDYQELFAEAYAMFISDPNTLRLLRPSTFRYFERRYGRRP